MEHLLRIPQREELIELIKSSTPPLDKIIKFEKLNYGKYYENIRPTWKWNEDLLNKESAKYLFLLFTEIDLEKARHLTVEIIQ